MSMCKACRVGPACTNGDNRPRPLKLILSSEQDLKLLLSRKRKLVSFAPNMFFSQELFSTRALEVSGAEGIQHRSNQGQTNLIYIISRYIDILKQCQTNKITSSQHSYINSRSIYS